MSTGISFYARINRSLFTTKRSKFYLRSIFVIFYVGDFFSYFSSAIIMSVTNMDRIGGCLSRLVQENFEIRLKK